MGVVVIAAALGEMNDLDVRLGEAAIDEATWTELRPGRWAKWLRVVDEVVARSVVADLRSDGVAAVLGPPDDAHAVGWTNRNRPTVINERLTVAFPWGATVGIDPSTVMEIDPGAGFGTGDHPSTVLMLRELATRIEGGEAMADIGCGSGVLAVAATRLGAARAIGVDINSEGLVAAHRNAARNGVAEQCEFSTTHVADLGGSYDVVVANIHAPILAEMASDLTRLLNLGGWLGLSGMSPAQLSVLRAAFPGVEFDPPVHLDEWSGLVGRRGL
ncbi:MAG: ribosomal protein L11 methyltransferase [Candidatus Poriferisodalaceae bacterium]|jgi:ribosomal protein L11 methyltransferase